MTKKAARSLGTILKIGADAIGELTSIGSPSITQEEIDVTTLDSTGGYREFLPGFKDPGEFTINGKYVTSDTGQAAMYAALSSQDLQDFEIIYPAKLGSSWSFKGFVSSFSITAELEDVVTFEATIRVSGEPTLATTASTGLSNLQLTGTGGTLAPTFDNGKYLYTFAGVSANSVTVTATATSHTLELYVDGAFAENLTSGAASSSIPLALGVAKKLTIIAYETGKAPVTYEVVALKTS